MNKFFYSIYLLIVFLSIWGPIPNTSGAILIILFFLIWFYFDKNFIYISPALTIPFIFILRSKSFESLVIAGLTDIMMIIAVSYYFLIKISHKQKSVKSSAEPTQTHKHQTKVNPFKQDTRRKKVNS